MQSVRGRGQDVLPTLRRHREIPDRALTGPEKYMDSLFLDSFECKFDDNSPRDRLLHWLQYVSIVREHGVHESRHYHLGA